MNVACESCHGPGSAHLAWTKRQKSWLPWGKGSNDGLTAHFDARRDLHCRRLPGLPHAAANRHGQRRRRPASPAPRLEALGGRLGREVVEAAQRGLADPDPLVRLAALRSLGLPAGRAGLAARSGTPRRSGPRAGSISAISMPGGARPPPPRPNTSPPERSIPASRRPGSRGHSYMPGSAAMPVASGCCARRWP